VWNKLRHKRNYYARRNYYLGKRKKWREQNADRQRLNQQRWWSEHQTEAREYRRRRRVRISEKRFTVTKRDLNRLLSRYNNSCAYCLEPSEPLHLDHVTPLKLGGRHSIGNLLPACASCNGSKQARLLAVWRHRR